MEQYLNPNQSRDHEPTDYENLLGDAIEQALARFDHERRLDPATIHRHDPRLKRRPRLHHPPLAHVAPGISPRAASSSFTSRFGTLP